MKPISSFLLIALLFISACASDPTSDPAYVSPTHYKSYNCEQISKEMDRVSKEIEIAVQGDAATKMLDTAFRAFAVSQGQYFSGEENDELRRYRNQYDVLEQTAIQKSCFDS